MSRRGLVAVVPFVIVVLVAVIAVSWMFSNPVEEGESVSLYIYPGDSGSLIADRIDSLEIFTPRNAFRLLSLITGLDRELKIGRYDFTSEDSRWDIYSTLKSGRSSSVKITIPEGWQLKRTLPVLAESTATDLENLWALSSDSSFLKTLGISAASLEGYLFPQTYKLPWGAPPKYTLAVLVESLDSFLTDSMRSRMQDLGFNIHELLTFASLVESEAMVGSERATISSVYHNRLRKHMLLQCDPTVIYAHGGLDRQLLRKDMKIDSPYNTYMYAGLPPGPICSPGAESIIASLYPEQTSYLYFVADGTGKHIFSTTLKQHNAAIRKIKSKTSTR